MGKRTRACKQAQQKNISYTRLVDDITISSKIHNYNFTLAIKAIEKLLHEKGLFFNEDKVTVSSISTELLKVHGLNVTREQPALPKREAKNIRAAVRNLESHATKKSERMELWYRKEFNRCRGRVYKLKRFGKEKSFRNLINRLDVIKPLPCKKDIRYAKIRVTRLEQDYRNTSKRDSYNYLRRYSIPSHRVAFLKGYYDDAWQALRERLKLILPTYEK